MVQLNQGDVRRYVGVASIVIGLVCYALSSSFNHLYGEWSSFKIGAYIVSSSIICLAILFPDAWQRIYRAILCPEARQHLRSFKYKVHMAFMVMIFTNAYSFYLDKKLNTKPDAYWPISSAAFAMTSSCMSKQDLLYFFCGLLTTQLLQIRPLLVFVGIAFSYFADIIRFYLDAPAPPNRSESQPPSAVVIDIEVPLLPSSALDARPQEEEEEGTDMVPSLQVEEEGTDTVPSLQVEEEGTDTVLSPQEEEEGTDMVPSPQEEEEGTDMVPSLQSSALDARPQEEGTDMVPSLQSSALDARPEEEGEGFRNRNRNRSTSLYRLIALLARQTPRMEENVGLPNLTATSRRRRQNGTRNKAVDGIIPPPPRRVEPLNRTARRRRRQ